MNSWPWMLRAAVVGLVLAASFPIAAQSARTITVTERAGVARSGVRRLRRSCRGAGT